MTALEIESVFRPDVLRGRVHGVTGGAHRIGEGIAKHLAHLGASVVILDRDEANLQRVAGDLERAGADALCLCGDVTDWPFLEDAFARIKKRWGRLDGWVNNVCCNLSNELGEQPMSDFLRVWEVNVLASWRSIQLAAPLMVRTGGGSVVNISSVIAQRAIARDAAYASAKAGMEGLTRALAVELAPSRIRVNTVAPGAIETPETRRRKALLAVPPQASEELQQKVIDAHNRLTEAVQPWPRGGEPNDIASAVVFLLSDGSTFITGSTMTVDGGLMADFKHPRVSRFAEALCEFHDFKKTLPEGEG